jgi:ubiquinone/menaquinone biosynthesis C-methylase UbiE
VAAAKKTEYVLGHSEKELERLQRQGAFYAEFTRRVLEKAGVREGMRVLDIGCGVGDVSMVAADLVGPSGHVLGLDRSSVALATARSRLDEKGLSWVTFEERDIHDLEGAGPFDAVVGRFILLHVPDAIGTLRGLLPHLAPGGRLAFIEIDLSSLQIVPTMAPFEEALGWIAEAYRRASIEPDMGSRLYSTYKALGLEPHLEAMSRVEGGPEADAYDYLADTVRSLLPSIEQLGVATAKHVDVDTLAERLRQIAEDKEHCIFYPRMVGGWARLEATSGA